MSTESKLCYTAPKRSIVAACDKHKVNVLLQVNFPYYHIASDHTLTHLPILCI